MLRLALRFELQSLLRSRARLLATLAYLGAAAFAISMGSRHVSAWEDALETAESAERESIDEVHGYFSRGESGPADRAWVNLEKPLWQAEYAGTRVLRQPSPLAGIAAGSVDPAPVAFRLRSRADPLSVSGARIENPETAAGAVDLVFVLTVLTPLLMGLLGFDIGGREREERIDRLVTVQAGAPCRWILARILAVVAITGVAVTLCCLLAGWVAGAPWLDTTALLAIALTYTLLWGGLLLLFSANARTARGGAFVFGALWTGVCLLVPAAISEVGLSQVQDDFGVRGSLDAREQQWSAYDTDQAARMEALYGLFPELKTLPGAQSAELDTALGRHTYTAARMQGLRERNQERVAQTTRAQDFVNAAGWTSPTLALTVGMERVAGVGPDAASAFQGYLMDSVEDRIRWTLVQAWTQRPLDQSSFDALVADKPAPFSWTLQRLGLPLLQLGTWLLLVWAVALLRLLRSRSDPA